MKSDIKLAKVDATIEQTLTLVEKYKVKEYPTLKFFVKGEEKEYGG